ncbi:desmin-like [Uloborus diversus]|uniref:desmin-like n=1 Tax=Uloborus diversus TaxID=327109 RepID=UPI00240A2F21|nr:desmin-like [Uloborus diversus]
MGVADDPSCRGCHMADESSIHAMSELQSKEVTIQSLEKSVRDLAQSENGLRLKQLHESILQDLKLRHEREVVSLQQNIDDLQKNLDTKHEIKSLEAELHTSEALQECALNNAVGGKEDCDSEKKANDLEQKLANLCPKGSISVLEHENKIRAIESDLIEYQNRLQNKLSEKQNTFERVTMELRDELLAQKEKWEKEKLEHADTEFHLREKVNAAAEQEKKLRENVKKYQRHAAATEKNYKGKMTKLESQTEDQVVLKKTVDYMKEMFMSSLKKIQVFSFYHLQYPLLHYPYNSPYEFSTIQNSAGSIDL